jgi:hypothetical protein
MIILSTFITVKVTSWNKTRDRQKLEDDRHARLTSLKIEAAIITWSNISLNGQGYVFKEKYKEELDRLKSEDKYWKGIHGDE